MSTITVTKNRFLFRRLDQLQVSARSYTRILKVGRTIADLSRTDRIELEHMAEVVHFRGLDKLLVLDRKRKGI